MRTKTSSHPVDEAALPPAASSLKTGQVFEGWRKRRQAVRTVLAGLAAPAGRIAPDDELSALEELVTRLEAENSDLQRQVRIYRELCVAD